MAQIKQVGIGRKSSGTIDGITYYTLNGKTFARSTPTMPASVYNTPEAKVRQTIFKFVQMHMKQHLRTIRQTITAKTGTPYNRYYSLNKKGLYAALQTLAEQYVDGVDVSITDVEAAISAYAAEHPTSINEDHPRVLKPGVLETYNDFIEPVGVDEERGAERSAIQDTSDFGAAVALEGHAAELSVGY